MAADHSNTITINIFLDPAPPGRQGFTTPLYLVDEAEGTGNGLNGERVATYGNYLEAVTAEAAGFISSNVLEALRKAFSQTPTPGRIKVARVDTVGLESYSDALDAVDAVDLDYYGVAIDSTADADILSISAAVEARKRFCVVQSADSDWLTANHPAALTALDTRERTAVVYHDAATAQLALAWMVSRLVFDPDFQSAAWTGEVKEVPALTTSLTTAQRDLAIANNVNLGLAFVGATVYVSRGVNQNNRPVSEIVSADWLAARLNEDLGALKLAYDSRGEKIPVSIIGQRIANTPIEQRLSQGEDVQHFNQGQTRSTPETISPDDITNNRLRFRVEAQVTRSATLLVVNAYLQQTELAEV